jgi:arylsulfatase A-like enzyme
LNLIWIIIDCLRPDHLGCYGYPRLTSPHIDRFAREAARFETVISPHIPTQPAHTTAFSSRDVFAHQIVAQGGARELDPSVPLLPRLLAERGYFTAAVDNIGRWFAPAFERYLEYPRWNHDGAAPWRNGEQVTAGAMEALAACRSAGRPFFLFLHYWDPHTPYLPPAPFDRMFYTGDPTHARHTSMEPVFASAWFANYFREWLDGIRDIEFVKAQYDASIAYTDVCVRHVLTRLEELSLLDESVIVIGADHGEELDEHGCWFDHHGLYETNVRVPLLIRQPGGVGAGRVVRGPVSFLDVAPTLLELAGLADVAAAAGMQGTSLVRRLQGEKDEPGTAEAVYLTECTWMRKRGWRVQRPSESWKLIEALEPDIYGKPPVELYDLAADPGETRNLAELCPEVVTRLQEEMRAWVGARRAATGSGEPLEEQQGALRMWQPRFIAGRAAAAETELSTHAAPSPKSGKD